MLSLPCREAQEKSTASRVFWVTICSLFLKINTLSSKGDVKVY